MNRTAVVAELHAILDRYLRMKGMWPVDEKCFPALYRKFPRAGFGGGCSWEPGTKRNTALGTEINLDLIMAFLGIYDVWDVPMILDVTDTSPSTKQKSCTFNFRRRRRNTSCAGT